MLVILAEVATQLERRELELQLDWVTRDQNEEADELTNMDFGRFAAHRRIPVQLEDMKWEVLDDLLRVADDLYSEVRARRAERTHASRPSARIRPDQRLRQRDPW